MYFAVYKKSFKMKTKLLLQIHLYIYYKGVITVYFYFSSCGNAYWLRQNTAFQILKHTILKVLTLNLIITCHATRKNFNFTLPCIIFHEWLKHFLGNVIIRRFVHCFKFLWFRIMNLFLFIFRQGIDRITQIWYKERFIVLLKFMIFP